MQEPLRPIGTAITVQTLPRRARTANHRTDEPLDSKQRQPEQHQSETNGTGQEQITLHDLIPPELLNIPQAVTSQSAALASYIANQSPLTLGQAPTDDRDSTGLGDDASSTINRQVIFEHDSWQDGTPPVIVLPSQKSMQLTGMNKASIDASYRTNNDEPVYVAVPDAVIASSSQASKLKTLTQNISDNVKNAYYKLMTMVPYSVGMLINVFA